MATPDDRPEGTYTEPLPVWRELELRRLGGWVPPEALQPPPEPPYSVTPSRNKRGPFYLVVLRDRVARERFRELADSARAAGGWYSRQWGRTPGGFGFPDELQARSWAREVTP